MAAMTSAYRSRAGRSHRRGAGVVLAALTVLTAAGCGGSGRSGEAVSSASSHRQISKSSSERPGSGASGQPSASAAGSAPASAPATAADGHDVGACADGTCEIAVSKPVSFRFKGPEGPATLSVTEVGANKIEYTVVSGSGSVGGGATGRGQGCVTVLRANGGSNSCGGLGPDAARPSPQPHAVVIQVVPGEDGTAILDMVSG